MTDPDVQYLRDIAKGYANSFIDGWQAEHRRLNAIADRLESNTRPAAEPTCCCGKPTTLGVLHRTVGPCYWVDTEKGGIGPNEPVAEPSSAGEAIMALADDYNNSETVAEARPAREALKAAVHAALSRQAPAAPAEAWKRRAEHLDRELKAAPVDADDRAISDALRDFLLRFGGKYDGNGMWDVALYLEDIVQIIRAVTPPTPAEPVRQLTSAEHQVLRDAIRDSAEVVAEPVQQDTGRTDGKHWLDGFAGATVGWSDDQMIRFAGTILLGRDNADSIEQRLATFVKHEKLRGIPTPPAEKQAAPSREDNHA